MHEKQTTPKRRRYVVRIEGYTDAEYIAATASAARYRAFRAFRDCGPRITFREFLHRATVLAMGEANA